MKCKVCGHRTNTIEAMSKHYRKEHPSRMKRMRKSEKLSTFHKRIEHEPMFCKYCGKRIE